MPLDQQHYHRDDCPAAVALIDEVRNGRTHVPGIVVTEHGIAVNWQRIDGSWLSSTEKATMQVARGLATIERSGGAGRLDAAIATAFHVVLDDSVTCVGGAA
jgi:hypothetical protein